MQFHLMLQAVIGASFVETSGKDEQKRGLDNVFRRRTKTTLRGCGGVAHEGTNGTPFLGALSVRESGKEAGVRPVLASFLMAWYLNGLSKSQCLGGVHCCRPAIAALEQHCDGNALEAMSGKLYQTRSNMGLGVPFAEDLSV